MRSTSAKCDLTAASSPLSQPIAIATAADHHLHTTSGPVEHNQELQLQRGHPAPSTEIDANEPKRIPQECSHPAQCWNVLQEHKGTWQQANTLH